MLFTASDVDFEEDISSDSDSECLETPSLEEPLEEEDESEQGQQIMVELECPASPISAVTEADIAKTATQDQEPSVIAFNPRDGPKKRLQRLIKPLTKTITICWTLIHLQKKNAKYLCRPEKERMKERPSDGQTPGHVQLGAKMLPKLVATLE